MTTSMQCQSHLEVGKSEQENPQDDIGESDTEKLADAKNGSEVVIEVSVEMKMYGCLKEKNYSGFIDLLNNNGGNINHTFNETFVDVPNRGWTALHFVCQRGNVKWLLLLLDLGADLSLTDKKGNTPLHMACKHGHYEICQLILEKDICVKDIQNLQGLTPLMKAIFRFDTAFKEKDYEKTITFLLEAGCDVNLRPKSNMSPLHVVAGKWKSAEMVRKLLRAGADIDADTGSSSPLMTALSRPRVDTATVLALIDAGANINYQNASLKSVLHIAVSKSEDACVERLLEAGGDPNVEDSDGNTPLWIAVCENDIKIAPLLIQYGGNVNFRNKKYGMSLLSKAVVNRNKNMVKLLLDHEANINTMTSLGASALHYAIDLGDLELIKMLLRENPDLDNYSLFKDLYNPQNAFQIALTEGNSFVIKLLLLVGMSVPYYQIKSKRLPSIVLDDDELVEWIQNFFHNPRPLQHLCRVEIRRHYRTEVGAIVTRLTTENVIPKRVANKILMKDILDDDISFEDELFDI